MSAMPQPMQGAPTSRGTLQRGPNGFVVKASGPAPAAGAKASGSPANVNLTMDAAATEGVVGAINALGQAVGQMAAMAAQSFQASMQAAQMIAGEIAALRQTIEMMNPTVNVAAPNVSVAAPNVSNTVNATPGEVRVTADVNLPPPKPKAVTLETPEGPVTGTVG